MKPSLQLRMGQHLTMTPQLQQAIRLLQLSALDLQTEIQEFIDSNPMLEIEEKNNSETNSDSNHAAEEGQRRNEADDFNESSSSPDDSTILTTDALTKSNISEDSPLDNSLEKSTENNSDGNLDGIRSNNEWDAANSIIGAKKDFDTGNEYYGGTTESLRDHLIWQLNLTPFSDLDRSIATALIDGIDDDGYLTVALDDILESFYNEADPLEMDEVEAVLHRIQQFDPLGVGCRDLRECLLCQLDQYAKDTAYFKQAFTLINEYLDLLGQKNYRMLMKKSGLSEKEIKQGLQLIQSLNPKPGSEHSNDTAEYVVPDVYVKKIRGRWQVDLNPEAAPRLKVNQRYANMVQQATSSADSKYLKNNLQEARWFIKSLESRNETLLKVSHKIVQEQQGFFEFGEEAMRPMVLSDIAMAVDMHESTISRVTTQKYLHCPSGIFELKYFFSSHVNTSSGGECSSTAIRALLKKLVEAENPQKPLSDSKISALLKDQGIMVARRTVAKYRESLNIPASNERKMLI